MSGILRFFALPIADLLRGQQRVLSRGRDLVWLLGGLLGGWWVYVPLHELLHAFGCLAAGGAVSRLEIDATYGGALLARLFPWVVAGSEYAGRLSGFDTDGSDAVYLATDLLPFVLTLPGVWALRRAARARRPALFGAAAPFALAPLLSLTGDAYEIGSILVTRLGPWTSAATLLRGDDVSKVFARVGAVASPPWGGVALAVVMGVLWAWGTYGLAAAAARALGQRALASAPAGERTTTTNAPPSGSARSSTTSAR